MKIFLRLSLSLTILAAFLQVRAQTEFSPGYIITYANDTIQGAISYAGDSICNFRQNNASEVKKFNLLILQVSGLREVNTLYLKM